MSPGMPLGMPPGMLPMVTILLVKDGAVCPIWRAHLAGTACQICQALSNTEFMAFHPFHQS
jgi:hypothetical protein